MYSDYEALDTDDVTLYEPKYGEGLIIHHGHIMYLKKGWRQSERTVSDLRRLGVPGVPAADPPFITAVHFPGN